MATGSSFYLQQAENCAQEAAITSLSNQRKTLLRSQTAWQALAGLRLLIETNRTLKTGEQQSVGDVAVAEAEGQEMSRAMNLKLPVDDVRSKCKATGVSISAIELLPSGDTHLVCTTGDGAAVMRQKYKQHIVEGQQKRFPLSVPPSRW